MVVLNLNIPVSEDIDVHYQRFTHCYALSDDLLLFKNDKKKVIGNGGEVEEIPECYAVFSIKACSNLKDFEWLSKGYDITAINLSDDADENRVALFVTKTIKSKSDKADDYVQFVVDPVTFQPMSEVHSTIRDKYILVQSKEDVEAIIQEDCECKPFVDFYSSEVAKFNRDKAKAKILSNIGIF